MVRQAKTSQRRYAIKTVAAITCAKCGVLTKAYRPAVINNKPVWVCSVDCK